MKKAELIAFLKTGTYDLSEIAEHFIAPKPNVSCMLSHYAKDGVIQMKKSLSRGCMVYTVPLYVSTNHEATISIPEPTTTDLNNIVETLSHRIVDQVMLRVMDELERRLTEMPVDLPSLRSQIEKLVPVKPTLPRVGIVGLLPTQAEILKRDFVDCLDLSFWNDEGTIKLKALCEASEVVVLHTRHMGHSADMIAKRYGDKIRRVTGGVSTVKRELEDFFVNRP